MKWLAVLLSLAACDRVFLNERLPERPSVDAGEPDAMESCGGVGLVTLCTTFDDDELSLRDTIDTTTHSLCRGPRTHAGFDDACVIAAGTITVPFPLRVVGARPLVLFADTIIIDAPIDASGDSEVPGPGARTDCATPGGTATAMFGGGGPGGSHQFTGGPGGSAGAGAAPTTAPSQAIQLAKLAGGCSGGTGGGGDGVATPSGAGGGAVWAIASIAITIGEAGGIDVSGGGGRGGAIRHGGGGGGAGGMIGLDAPVIALDGNLISKGGAGGGGGGTAIAGLPGREADLAGPFDGVFGGVGGGASPGNGGDGSNGTVGGFPTSGAYGGGGGGGGAGYILLSGTTTITGQINPPP